MSKCKRCPQRATFKANVENKINTLESHYEHLCGNCLKVAAKNDEVLDYWPKEDEKESSTAQK